MRRYIPSSMALKCFEASVRHLSFTHAAQELHLTQSAVSRQIRKLENFLARDLFIRMNKRLALTESGTAYYREIVPLLDAIERASLKMQRENNNSSLTICSLPTLASYWLMPKLAQFQQAYPDIQISLYSLDDYANLDSEKVDVILHYGGDHWPSAVSHQLMKEDVIAVCSPDLLAQYSDKQHWSAKDVLMFPLLHLTSRINAWADWLAAHQVEHGPVAQMTFDHFHMLLEAAKNRMGVAIVPSILAENALNKGEVVAPFADKMPTTHEYLLSYSASKTNIESVRFFRDWLLQS